MPEAIETDQPQGELQPMQGGISAQANPDQLGGSVASALWQSGEVAQKVFHDTNQAVVQDFHNQQMQWESASLHDPKNGVLYQNSGLQAPAVVDKTLQNYDQFTSKATQGMNSAQRQIAQPYIDQHKAMLQDQLLKYEHEQVSDAHVQIMDQGIALHGNAMIQHAGDPAAVEMHIQAMKALGNDQGRMLGWDQGKIDEFNNQQISNASFNMLHQMVAQDQGPQASAWLQEHPGIIQGPKLTEATDMLKQKDNNDQAMAVAHSIINQVQPADKPMDLQRSLETLDSKGITNAALYDASRAEIAKHFTLQQEAVNQRDQTQLQSIVDAQEAAKGGPINPALTVGASQKVLAAADRNQKMIQQQKYAETDPGTYAQIYGMMSDMDNRRATFGDGTTPGSFDLNEYRDKLSPAHFTELSKAIDTTRKQIAENDDKLSQGQIGTDVTKRLFAEQQLDQKFKPGSPEDAAQQQLQGRFLMQYHRMAGAEQLKLQRNLTPDEGNQIAQKLFATKSWTTTEENPNRPENQSWFGVAMDVISGDPVQSETITTQHSSPVYQIEGADKLAYSIRDIPQEERERQVALAAKAGVRNPREQQIIDAYNQSIRAQYPDLAR